MRVRGPVAAPEITKDPDYVTKTRARLESAADCKSAVAQVSRPAPPRPRHRPLRE